MTDWHVGQKVVCVDASGDLSFIVSGWLEEAAVYSIRTLTPWNGRIGVRLHEIRCAAWVPNHNFEKGFWIERFRPVVCPQADISVFQRVLDRVNKREVIDA